MRAQAIKGFFIFPPVSSGKDNLRPGRIIVRDTAQIEAPDAEETVDPVILTRIHIRERSVRPVCFLNDRKRIGPVFSPQFLPAARLVGVCLIFIAKIEDQIGRIFLIQLEQAA